MGPFSANKGVVEGGHGRVYVCRRARGEEPKIKILKIPRNLGPLVWSGKPDASEDTFTPNDRL